MCLKYIDLFLFATIRSPFVTVVRVEKTRDIKHGSMGNSVFLSLTKVRLPQFH